MAGAQLKEVVAPTLLLVGSLDEPVIGLNRLALAKLRNAKLVLVPGATHLFGEPGTMERVQREAGEWFLAHFTKGARLATA